MNIQLTERQARAAGMIGDQEYNDGILAAEALARAQAAFLDAIAKYNRVQNTHQIDVEAVEATLHDEIPTPGFLIEMLEDARRGL